MPPPVEDEFVIISSGDEAESQDVKPVPTGETTVKREPKREPGNDHYYYGSDAYRAWKEKEDEQAVLEQQLELLAEKLVLCKEQVKNARKLWELEEQSKAQRLGRRVKVESGSSWRMVSVQPPARSTSRVIKSEPRSELEILKKEAVEGNILQGTTESAGSSKWAAVPTVGALPAPSPTLPTASQDALIPDFSAPAGLSDNDPDIAMDGFVTEMSPTGAEYPTPAETVSVRDSPRSSPPAVRRGTPTSTRGGKQLSGSRGPPSKGEKPHLKPSKMVPTRGRGWKPTGGSSRVNPATFEANNSISDEEADANADFGRDSYRFPSEAGSESDSNSENYLDPPLLDWSEGGKLDLAQVIEKIQPPDQDKFADVPAQNRSFARYELSAIIGGSPQSAWPTPAKNKAWAYNSGQYSCLNRRLNHLLPKSAGEAGGLLVARRNLQQIGKTYPMFLGERPSGTWVYYGSYKIVGLYTLTLEEWRSLGSTMHKQWAAHIISKKWGRKILLKKGIITKAQYTNYKENNPTIASAEVLEAFEREDEDKPNLRLLARLLQPVAYDRKLFDALVKGRGGKKWPASVTVPSKKRTTKAKSSRASEFINDDSEEATYSALDESEDDVIPNGNDTPKRSTRCRRPAASYKEPSLNHIGNDEDADDDDDDDVSLRPNKRQRRIVIDSDDDEEFVPGSEARKTVAPQARASVQGQSLPSTPRVPTPVIKPELRDSDDDDLYAMPEQPPWGSPSHRANSVRDVDLAAVAADLVAPDVYARGGRIVVDSDSELEMWQAPPKPFKVPTAFNEQIANSEEWQRKPFAHELIQTWPPAYINEAIISPQMFSRRFLSSVLGGGEQTKRCRPSLEKRKRQIRLFGKVICAFYSCEKADWDPHMPPKMGHHGLVYFGVGEREHNVNSEVKEHEFEHNNGLMPVFCRRASNNWEYCGDYLCTTRQFVPGEYESIPESTKKIWSEWYSGSGKWKRGKQGLETLRAMKIITDGQTCDAADVRGWLDSGRMKMEAVTYECKGFNHEMYHALCKELYKWRERGDVQIKREESDEE